MCYTLDSYTPPHAGLAMNTPLQIDLFFDYGCPWCYITEMALERLADRYDLAVALRAFPLWPQGMVHLSAAANERLRQQTQAADAYAIQAAQAWLGIEGMSLGPWGVNTVEAHIGAGFAAARGRLQAYQHALFAAQFHRNLRLDDRATLLALAVEAGLPADAFDAALADPVYRERVRLDQEQAQRLGITGVPALILDRRYLLIGAQPPTSLAAVIEHVLAQRAE
jgi:predicted DsbA family dithiol-disulfide isomerase